MVAAYLRVSKQDQVEGFSLEAQEAAIRAHCARADLGHPVLYVEPGRTAFKERIEHRPVFARMLADAEAGAFRTVLVQRYDRFARWATVQLVAYDRLRAARVRLVSVTEPIDPATAFGKRQFTQAAADSEYYSAALSERLIEAFQVKREKGHKLGPTCYGGRRNPATGQQEIDPAWEAHLRRFLEVATEHSYVDTCAILNAEGVPARWGGPWHPATVGSVLRHGAWLVRQGESWAALWRAAATKRPAPPMKREAKARLLTGLVRCACGGSIGWRVDRRGPTYCVCINYKERPGGSGCPRGFRRHAEWYERRVTDWFLALPDLESWEPIATDEVALARRASLVERRRRLGVRYEVEDFPEADYRAQVVGLNAEIAAIDRAAKGDRVGVIRGTGILQRKWPRMTVPERNQALRLYLRRVVIDGQTIHVEPFEDILAALASVGFTHPLH